MWTNPLEIPDNGVDEVGNGYIDDYYGYNFYSDSGNPLDDQKHGSHCAGTIGAVGNNGVGVVGVNWQVSLMAVKFLSASGSGKLSDALDAIADCHARGVHLTSNSWVGTIDSRPGPGNPIYDVFDGATAAKSPFVAAAGNSGVHLDAMEADLGLVFYPAGVDHPSIISVGSSTASEERSLFSNFSPVQVDLFAPGSDIYSTVLGTDYAFLIGTSMATPHVAGVAALVQSFAPGQMSVAELKQVILDSVEVFPQYQGKVLSGGRLNAAQAVAFVSTNPIVKVVSAPLIDDGNLGSIGNGDGVPSPGETVAIPYVVQNLNFQSPAGGVSVAVSLESADSDLRLTNTNATLGSVASRAQVAPTLPLRIQISPGATTPKSFTLVFQISDNQGGSWQSRQTYTVYKPASFSGVVRKDGVGIGGATVYYSGPWSGSVTTGANGSYTITGIYDGTYTLYATLPGAYRTASVVRTMNTTTTAQAVDFDFTTTVVAGRVTQNGTVPWQGVPIGWSGALSGTVNSDAGGNYSFSVVTGQPCSISVQARPPADIFSQSVAQSLPATSPRIDFDFTYVSLAGTVLEDASGSPVEGATVAIFGPLEQREQVTGPDGSFQFSFYAGRTASVSIEALKGGVFGPVSVSRSVPPSHAGIELRLQDNWYTIGRIPPKNVAGVGEMGVWFSNGQIMNEDGLLGATFSELFTAHSFTYRRDFSTGTDVINHVHDLNTPARTVIQRVNDLGMVAGYTQAGSIQDSVLPSEWQGDNHEFIRRILGADESMVYGIDAEGTIYGRISGTPQLWYKPRNRPIVWLPRKSGFFEHYLIDVNRNGEMLFVLDQDTSPYPFLLCLGTIEQYLNDTYTVVYATVDNLYRVYTAALNNHGDVAFHVDPGDPGSTTLSRTRWLWTRATHIFEPLHIPGVADGDWSVQGINDNGWISANDDNSGYVRREGVWEPLSSLIPASGPWTLNSVAGISNDGIIYGGGSYNGNSKNGFVLFPPRSSSPGRVQFSVGQQEIAETAGQVTVTVTREAGYVGAASVEYTTEPGTADENLDFTPVSGTLTWGDWDDTAATITIPITNDAEVDGRESFRVVLSNLRALG